jgi:sodium-dependent dicarboxylate transporter 2/3/5
MTHTAVAATMFPILLAIYALYGEGERQSNFGKALFIGMAYAAGAGSIITFLGAACGPAAAGMYKEFTGQEIGFFELTSYMFLIGWLMVFAIWFYLITFLKPEKDAIPGLKHTVKRLADGLGPMTAQEKTVLGIVLGVVLLMSLKGVVPFLQPIDRAALMLLSTLLFFIFGILGVKNLEEIPWNIILLFSGAMSIGFCLWQIGAAPNAIAYDSRQFSTGEFFRHGVPMSLLLLVVLALAVTVLWPLLGMPVLVG